MKNNKTNIESLQIKTMFRVNVFYQILYKE